ncbi:hypothetical protein FOZ62_004783, partial [Perkinsus olseni]
MLAYSTLFWLVTAFAALLPEVELLTILPLQFPLDGSRWPSDPPVKELVSVLFAGFWYFPGTMMFSCGTLIALMAGVLAGAELIVTDPRGNEIEDTSYCMVDAGSKGKAVFELLEVAEPIWEGRVALGEIPSPRVKKPASVDITVEAVIETRQAADGH